MHRVLSTNPEIRFGGRYVSPEQLTSLSLDGSGFVPSLDLSSFFEPGSLSGHHHQQQCDNDLEGHHDDNNDRDVGNGQYVVITADFIAAWSLIGHTGSTGKAIVIRLWLTNIHVDLSGIVRRYCLKQIVMAIL